MAVSVNKGYSCAVFTFSCQKNLDSGDRLHGCWSRDPSLNSSTCHQVSTVDLLACENQHTAMCPWPPRPASLPPSCWCMLLTVRSRADEGLVRFMFSCGERGTAHTDVCKVGLRDAISTLTATYPKSCLGFFVEDTKKECHYWSRISGLLFFFLLNRKKGLFLHTFPQTQSVTFLCSTRQAGNSLQNLHFFLQSSCFHTGCCGKLSVKKRDMQH